jgi:multiple sugar transport system permease protein
VTIERAQESIERQARPASNRPSGPQGPDHAGPGPDAPATEGRSVRLSRRLDRLAANLFIWPAILVVLLLAIFPLVVSLGLSFSRLEFVTGGFQINFVGLANYQKLFFGSEQTHFLGLAATPTWLGWTVLIAFAGVMVWSTARYISVRHGSLGGLVWRIVAAVLGGLIIWMLVRTLSPAGRPGTISVTLIYVFVGIIFQYVLGLGLALLCTQRLPGRRFFRVVYLLPMMITPVGVAYMFRMLTDTQKGPFRPIWVSMGLMNFSWVNNAWGARAAVMIGDIWQWTPFMFIVLLAALEGQSVEQVEAATVDGANSWQVFWNITLPDILPVSMTLILIRLIEAFKIVDLPNVLTNGGPGTATESLTLQAYFAWRTLNLGGSAAIGYVLLVLVSFVAIVLVNVIRARVVER